jgi:hypothetical protein
MDPESRVAPPLMELVSAKFLSVDYTVFGMIFRNGRSSTGSDRLRESPAYFSASVERGGQESRVSCGLCERSNLRGAGVQEWSRLSWGVSQTGSGCPT